MRNVKIGTGEESPFVAVAVEGDVREGDIFIVTHTAARSTGDTVWDALTDLSAELREKGEQ